MLSPPTGGTETYFMPMKPSNLKKIPAAKAKRATGRFGRPPKGLAGEGGERILDAARKVFLERRFAGTSIDEIAEVARSGKPTIYARFSGKEALFEAVVMRSVAANIAHFDSYTPTGANIEERLESIAATVLEWILLSD